MRSKLRQLILFLDNDPFGLFMGLLILFMCTYLIMLGAGLILLQAALYLACVGAALWCGSRVWIRLVKWAKQG